MDRLRKALPAVASALLLLAAFPPFNLGLLVFVALVPWINSLRDMPRWAAFRSGVLFGLIFMGGQFEFLVRFVYKWTQSLALGVIPALIATILASLYFGWAASLMALCWRKKWPALIPLVWVGIEVFRSFIPSLAFPWGLVHTPLFAYPSLIQLAHFGTAYLVSFMVIWANLFFATGMHEGFRTSWIRYGLPLVVMFAASGTRYQAPFFGEPTKVLVAQPGVDMAFQSPEEEDRQIAMSLSEIFERTKTSDAKLMVLPEGLANASDQIPPMTPFRIPDNPPVIFGGQRGLAPSYQTAFSYDGTWQWADKKRLVIFGEYVPLRNQLPFLKNFDLPSGDLVPSDKTTAISVNGIKVGPLLCFEGLFIDVANAQARNGAQLLAVMSLDDWYMETGAPVQLMAGSVFRAIECGTPLLRSASLGHSIVVDPRGNIVHRAPLMEQYVMEAEVMLPKSPDWFGGILVFPYVALFSLLGVPIAALWRRGNSETPAQTQSPPEPN